MLTKDQLQKVWDQLDGACEALEQLDIHGINLGDEELSRLNHIKSKVEFLIEEQEKLDGNQEKSTHAQLSNIIESLDSLEQDGVDTELTILNLKSK